MIVNVHLSPIADLKRWMTPGKHLARFVSELPDAKAVTVKDFLHSLGDDDAAHRLAKRELRAILQKHPLPKGVSTSRAILGHLKRRKPLRGRAANSRAAIDQLVSDGKVFDALMDILATAGVPEIDLIDIKHELRPNDFPRGSKSPHFAIKRAAKSLARSKDGRTFMASVIAHYQDDAWNSATGDRGAASADWFTWHSAHRLFNLAALTMHGGVAEWARAYAIEIRSIKTLVSPYVDAQHLKQAIALLEERIRDDMPTPMPIRDIIEGTNLNEADIERAVHVMRCGLNVLRDYVVRVRDDDAVTTIILHELMRFHFRYGPVVIDALVAVDNCSRGRSLDRWTAERIVDAHPHLFGRVWKIPQEARQEMERAARVNAAKEDSFMLPRH